MTNAPVQNLQVIRKKFLDGRIVHEMVVTLYRNFQIFHEDPGAYLDAHPQGPNEEVFFEIISLFNQKDSEILAKLFSKILKMPAFRAVITTFCIQSSGVTLLHLAAKYGHDKVVKKMLKYGVNPSMTTGIYERGTTFRNQHLVCKIEAGKNYLEFARSYHEWCVRQTLNFPNGESFFNTSINNKHPRNFPLTDHRVIGAVADVNQPDENGETLLHLALTNNFSLPVILALLERGANPLIPNRQGQTALDKVLLIINPIPVDLRPKIILALFLDAAYSFDPKNLEKYQKIKQEALQDRNFLHLLLDGDIDQHLGKEFQICESLKEPYNPIAFAFERIDPLKPNAWGRLVRDEAQLYLDQYEKDGNIKGVNMLNTFVLPLFPLFEERIAVTKAASALLMDPPANLPKAVMSIIVSYLIPYPEAKARIAIRAETAAGLDEDVKQDI